MKASMWKTIRAGNGWQWLRGLVKECISIFTQSQCKLFHFNFLNTILCSDLIFNKFADKDAKAWTWKADRDSATHLFTLWLVGGKGKNWKEWKNMIFSEK